MTIWNKKTKNLYFFLYFSTIFNQWNSFLIFLNHIILLFFNQCPNVWQQGCSHLNWTRSANYPLLLQVWVLSWPQAHGKWSQQSPKTKQNHQNTLILLKKRTLSTKDKLLKTKTKVWMPEAQELSKTLESQKVPQYISHTKSMIKVKMNV